MTRTGFIVAVIGVAMIGTAGSAIARPHGGVDFDVLDRDGNGEVTLEELRGARDARFQASDVNGDGVLSRDEIMSGVTKRQMARIDKMIERFDKDGDGSLSLDELPERRRGGDRAERMFEHADLDGNGTLSRAELEEVRERMAERGGHRKPASE
ncbi:MAG: EF-hand domain-containing protein [Arenibacterium sp.]